MKKYVEMNAVERIAILKEIKNYINNKDLKARCNKPQVSSQRFYLYNILIYTLGFSDEETARLFERHRSSITVQKDLAFYAEQNKDVIFLEAVKELKTLFPFTLDIMRKKNGNEKVSIGNVSLSKSSLKKLKKFKEQEGLFRFSNAIEKLINLYL